jgi:hypothetical protein
MGKLKNIKNKRKFNKLRQSIEDRLQGILNGDIEPTEADYLFYTFELTNKYNYGK